MSMNWSVIRVGGRVLIALNNIAIAEMAQAAGIEDAKYIVNSLNANEQIEEIVCKRLGTAGITLQKGAAL